MASVGSPVTFAEVQIRSDPRAAISFDIEEHALKVAFVDREALKSLKPEEDWNKPGVYVLIGPLGTQQTEVYVGKSGGGKQGVRGRLLTHNSNPAASAKFGWWRAIAIVRDTTDGFDSAQIGYLEGRLTSELKALPHVKVRSDRGDLDTSLNEVKQLTLDAFVPSILRALKIAGIPLRQEKPEEELDKKQHFGVSVPDLVANGDLQAGAELTFRRKGKVATATVTKQGELRINGVAYKTPSEAGKVAQGLKNRPRGWTDWKLDGGYGKSLADIRDEYLKKLGSS